MAGTETMSEAQVAWTRDEIEPEAESHMVEIEDEFQTLSRWTHTFPTILAYRTARCLGEKSQLL